METKTYYIIQHNDFSANKYWFALGYDWDISTSLDIIKQKVIEHRKANTNRNYRVVKVTKEILEEV